MISDTRGKARILVVDDDPDTTASLAILLRYEGYDVLTALTGEAALARIEALRPHVILLDLGMPDRSGYEVARAIRAAAWEPRPLIVAITGSSTSAARMAAADAGFDHFLVKPITFEALGEILQGAAGDPPPPPPAGPAPRPAVS